MYFLQNLNHANKATKHIMKNFITALCLLLFTAANAQVKLMEGTNSEPFSLVKSQPTFASYATDNTDYLIVKRVANFENINTLIIADKAGTIKLLKEVKINRGTFTENAEVHKIMVVGNTPVAFVERHSKGQSKNTLTVQTIDAGGDLSIKSITVGEFSFTKMGNPGDWYTTLTPDKKHIAVIGQLPHEKDTPDQFLYFLLDENLKETGKGQVSFAGNTKKIPVFNFLASDKGDLYIITEEFDKSYKYPVVYQVPAGSNATTITPVMPPDPTLRNLNYTASVNAAGQLILAGYTQQKKTFSMNDVDAKGTWLFNSAKPLEVKLFPFEKSITNLTARNIIYNGDTFFLVGEQYKEEKEASSATGLARLNMEDNFKYTHENIQVTAFNNDGVKKFDLPMSRKWSARNFDEHLMVASGIINNKLALVYNDQYGKYFEGDYSKNYKLPVAVLVNNDGLMDAPVNFAAQLHSLDSPYSMYAQFFSSSNNRVIVLFGNGTDVKTETFK
jgi:hypothetical protein